jgi:hypothetical protein
VAERGAARAGEPGAGLINHGAVAAAQVAFKPPIFCFGIRRRAVAEGRPWPLVDFFRRAS